MTNWQDNIITTAEQIRELLGETKTIAVLGIKTEAQSNQPAFYVPNYMDKAGFDIIPVPVYYPNAKKPKSVWMQMGISDDAVAERLAKEGIKVVQDRCLMVDHRRLGPANVR